MLEFLLHGHFIWKHLLSVLALSGVQLEEVLWNLFPIHHLQLHHCQIAVHMHGSQPEQNESDSLHSANPHSTSLNHRRFAAFIISKTTSYVSSRRSVLHFLCLPAQTTFNSRSWQEAAVVSASLKLFWSQWGWAILKWCFVIKLSNAAGSRLN